ncbi:MAG: flagellar hook protein FlgE [Parahaliea sp.]
MAFDTAISGINAATADLNVISNNIANVSTVGFKSSRAEFADVYAQSLLGTTGNRIGKGVTVAAVSQQFGQGNISFTDNSLDLAINGAGFFQLSRGGALEYSRAGPFEVDTEGYVVSKQGARLQGYGVSNTGEVTGRMSDIHIDTSLIDPNPTGSVKVSANLDSREVAPATAFGGPFDAFAAPPTAPDPSTYNATTSTTVYDGLGNPHVLSLYYVKTASPNEWEVHSLIDGVTTSGPDTLTFQSNGQFDPATLPVDVSVTGWAPLKADGSSTGAAAQDMTISLSDTTQYGTSFAVDAIAQDGFGPGQLRGLDIDKSGVVFARFTNGESRALSQIALANFSNVNGLQPSGDTNWVETYSSGAPNVGAPGTSGLGVLQSSALEGSNVEITAQLVDLIVAQRNFQANAQVIQSEDAITQTVINLR